MGVNISLLKVKVREKFYNGKKMLQFNLNLGIIIIRIIEVLMEIIESIG